MMATWDLARHADVAELVDAPDLGSGAERRGGSSPFIRTIFSIIPLQTEYLRGLPTSNPLAIHFPFFARCGAI